MDNTNGDDLLTRLMGAAVGDAESGDRTALIERLFAALPAESQERLLRDLLDQLVSAETPTAAEPPEPEPQQGHHGDPRPPFMWKSGDNLPFRNIGPWQTCCRMMANVDQATTVHDVEAGLPAEVFAALGDETRIRIIRLLQDHERQADDIARTLDIPQSTLSHHLRVLRTAGLIQVDRRGRSSFYSLAQPHETI